MKQRVRLWAVGSLTGRWLLLTFKTTVQ